MRRRRHETELVVLIRRRIKHFPTWHAPCACFRPSAASCERQLPGWRARHRRGDCIGNSGIQRSAAPSVRCRRGPSGVHRYLALVTRTCTSCRRSADAVAVRPPRRTLPSREASIDRGDTPMCERLDRSLVPDLSSIASGRRSFMKRSAAGVITMAAPPGPVLRRCAGCRPRVRLRSTHGTGFCNLQPLPFARVGRRPPTDGLTIEFVNTPTFAEQVTFLGIGEVDVGLMPYTSFVALFDAGAPRSRSSPAAASKAAPSSPSPVSTAPRSSSARRSAPSSSTRSRSCPTTGSRPTASRWPTPTCATWPTPPRRSRRSRRVPSTGSAPSSRTPRRC